MNQPDQTTLARATDPLTSHEAAERTTEFAPNHRARVKAALQRLGRAGAEQIAEVTDMPAYSIRKRLPELEREGAARPTDATRKTSSGRSERLWEAR